MSCLTCDRRKTGDAGVSHLPLKKDTFLIIIIIIRIELILSHSLTFFPSLNLTGPSITGVRSHIFLETALLSSDQSHRIIIL